MIFADSHCHLHRLDLTPYQGSLDDAIAAAQQHGINHILNVCVDLEEVPHVIAIAERFPHVYASVGLHPSEKVAQEPTVVEIVKLAQHPKVVAIGETGLDYHYNDSGLDSMRERFRVQVRAAAEVKKPIIVHSRAANEDTMVILREAKALGVTGVMHCFTETWELAEVALDCGFYISFSGIITFKNATNVVAVAERVPLERILIETDAPYLTPIPFRGKPNAPEYVRYTAEKIAEIKKVSVAQVAQQTTENYLKLFGLLKPASRSS